MDLTSLKTSRVILLFTCFTTATQGLSQGDWTQFGVRPLGMGNAFVAVADDFNALYYNPAGLARLKDWSLEVLNPTFTLSSNTYFLAKDSKTKKVGKALSDTISLISDEAGQPNYVSVGLSPYFIAPGWGFGLTSSTYVSFIAHRNVDVETEAFSKLTVPVSVARNYFSDRLSVGATIKAVALAGLDQDISVDTISLISSKQDSGSDQKVSDFLVSGAGLGFDLGMLFTPKENMEPTLGISIMDVGGTKLRKIAKEGTTARTIIPTVNTGVSFNPFKTERNYLLVALDAHMINQSSHFSHKLNFGLEYGFFKFFKLQTGLHQGYITGGVQFDAMIFKLRLATYAVDRSPLVGLEKNLVDRRVVLQLKLII
jgi:hypothetical protein